MGIHKQGYSSILVAFLISGIGILASYFLIGNTNWVFILLSAAFILFFLFVSFFFRYPKLKIEPDSSIILCPADGKVVAIEKITESEYFNKVMTQISIFMSPLDTHLNRYPISGKIDYREHHQGKNLVAWHPKSSFENERVSYALSNDKISLMVRQIAGAVARRIVPFDDVDHNFEQGEQMGFIKFGSRVDLFLPHEIVDLNIDLNQIVKAGKTVIARVKV